jgi:hypothetical protein
MSLNYDLVVRCLDEIESELLRIGKAKCNLLADNTQLSAVVTLLLRAGSLLRSLLGLLKRGELDSYDIIKRAFYEAWLLAFEFRLDDSKERTLKWHSGASSTWSPDISKLHTCSKSLGIEAPGIGRDYGNLSEISHPTKKASGQSVRVTTSRHAECRDVAEAIEQYEYTDVPAMLHGLVWVIEDRPGWISMGVSAKEISNALEYARTYAERLG